MSPGWLAAAAAVTAVVHTVIPDHWLPFVLAGRARGWSGRRAAAAALLSATLHSTLSLLLGVLALAAGRLAAERWGQTLHLTSGLLLVASGLLYAGWAWRKGAHFHPGGAWLHRSRQGACPGDEGPAHPQHLHYHADERWIQDPDEVGAVALAVVVGLNPCVLLLPLFLAAAEFGGSHLLAVGIAYTAATLPVVAGLSAAGVRLARRVRLPGSARHLETASGLAVAGLGVLFVFLD